MKTRIVALAAAALLCCGVTSALADPIVITSGVIDHEFGLSIPVELNSSAFTLRASDFNYQDIQMPAVYRAVGPPLSVPRPGDVVDLSATINGTFHEWASGQPIDLHLNFVAAPLLVTASTDLEQMQTLFSMTGTVGSRDVAGGGTLTAGFDDYARFVFTPPNSAPTPEPASLLLLGAGIVGALVRRVRAG